MPTTAQRERTQLRTKLYSGHEVPGSGRGGGIIPESRADASHPGLVQMWPKYLAMERRVRRCTVVATSEPHGLHGFGACLETLN